MWFRKTPSPKGSWENVDRMLSQIQAALSRRSNRASVRMYRHDDGEVSVTVEAGLYERFSARGPDPWAACRAISAQAKIICGEIDAALAAEDQP